MTLSAPEPERASKPAASPVLASVPDLGLLLPDSESPLEFPVSESPSRMLDLDFSTLTAPVKTEEDSEPLKTPPARYATRSRWPVTKKPIK
jgi:hypothetical protein